MNKTIKSIALAIAISLPIFLVSCGEGMDLPDRTPATEQSEINQIITGLEKQGYDIDTTDLGVFYIMHKEGTGPFPQKSDTCGLVYTGYFLNGSIFDSSGNYYTDSIWHFQYLDVALIPGFNDGVALLNKGAEADIIIPSEFAYGSTGNGPIQPYTPIFFSMKMKELKPFSK